MLKDLEIMERRVRKLINNFKLEHQGVLEAHNKLITLRNEHVKENEIDKAVALRIEVLTITNTLMFEFFDDLHKKVLDKLEKE